MMKQVLEQVLPWIVQAEAVAIHLDLQVDLAVDPNADLCFLLWVEEAVDLLRVDSASLHLGLIVGTLDDSVPDDVFEQCEWKCGLDRLILGIFVLVPWNFF